MSIGSPFLYVRVLTPPTGLASLTSIVVGPADVVELEPPVPMTIAAAMAITTATPSMARRWLRGTRGKGTGAPLLVLRGVRAARRVEERVRDALDRPRRERHRDV